MKNSRNVVVVAVLVLALGLGVIYSGVGVAEQGGAAGSIGAAEIGLFPSEDFKVFGGDFIRVFIPTRSDSRQCLVTMSEASTSELNPEWVFCGQRTIDGEDGVLVSLGFENPVPDGGFLSFTVLQDKANGYGDPVVCPNDVDVNSC